MKMRRIIFLSGMLTVASAAMAQTEVVQGVMQGKDYGVTYMLPNTLLDIEATVTEVIYTPGEFAKYANRYLRLNNVSTTPDQYYELNSIKVVPVGIPNPEQTYFIKMRDRSAAPLVELTNDGIIKSINVPYDRKSAQQDTNTSQVISSVRNPRDFLTEDILMANSSAKMAELVAKEIYAIRESKNALVRGQADVMPQDGQQMKLMLDALNEQEESLMSMFIGSYKKINQTYQIKISPREVSKEVAFRFSKKLGIVASNNLAGEPVYISITDLKTVAIPEDNKNKKKVEGIAYNVPGKAYVEITMGKQTLYKEEVAFAQFGTTEYLAPLLFNKNSTIKVYFNPATGGLIKVEREEHK